MAFEFKGNWEFDFKFNAFKGLQSRRGAYTSLDNKSISDGTVKVSILEESNHQTTPAPAQIRAINYLIENSENLRKSLFTALKKEYPRLKKIHNYHNENEYSRSSFPDIESLEDFSKVFGVGNVFVLTPEKEGISYIGLECGCTWDEEHGLGFILHKDRLINIGGADIAFRNSDAKKDSAT